MPASSNPYAAKYSVLISDEPQFSVRCPALAEPALLPYEFTNCENSIRGRQFRQDSSRRQDGPSDVEGKLRIEVLLDVEINHGGFDRVS